MNLSRFSLNPGILTRVIPSIAFVIAWSLGLCMNLELRSQTLSGTLEADENWSGEIILEGDVWIPAGVTLTIAPGATIKSHPLQDTNQTSDRSRVELMVDGGILVAVGTSDAPIQFLSNADIPEPGDWGGIQVNDGNVSLQHFIINDAYTALRFNDGDNRFNEYAISDGSISGSKARGLWLNGEGENVRSILFNRLTIQDTFTDPDSNPELEGVGVFLEGPAELVDCRILNSARVGVLMDTSDPDVILTRCEILGSGRTGVFNDQYGSLTISDSNISDNGLFGLETDGGQLTLENTAIRGNSGGIKVYLWYGNDATIRNCFIENNRGEGNGDGIHIYQAHNGSVITIEGNTIHNNRWDGLEFSTGNYDISFSISGNTITQNNIGVLYRDGLDKVLSFSGNHIADNAQAEVHDENNWPIVADGNSWGTALSTELSQSVWNFAHIYDARDNWYVGQVLIRDWYAEDATSETPGELLSFNYQRPGITQIVSGEITDQQIWSGNVLITGDVVIQPGGVLIIEPGTRVLFEPLRDTENSYWHSRSELVLQGGSLIAEGTSENPIRFTSASPEFRPQEDWIGDWRGFRINDGDIAMKHFEISFATYGMQFNDIDTRFNSYDISDGVIHDSRRSGILFDSAEDRTQLTTLSKITIQDTHTDSDWNFNAIGIGEWNFNANGIGIWAQSPIELVECFITRSDRDGIFALDRAGVILTDSQLIANGRNGVYCEGTQVRIEGSMISESGSDGVKISGAGLEVFDSEIIDNSAAGINATPFTNDDFNVQNSLISGNEEGINFRNGWNNTDITIAGNQIVNNTGDGLVLDPGNSESLRFTETGISGNLISGNLVGLRYGDGLDRVLNLRQNHIANNTAYEIYNENNWPIVADGNSWGEETTQELLESKLNLTQIHDTRDDVEIGQVLIRDYFTTSAVDENPGTPQPFDYSRPGLGQVVSGSIVEDQTWSGHVLVTGDVLIEPAATLTIAPGTLVEFELLRDTNVSGWWLSRSELIVNGGNLIANGAVDNPIVFTTSSPDSRAPEDYPGDWLGLRLNDGNMELTHFEIHYAMYGIVFNDNDNRFSEISVSDGLITRSNRAGVWFNGEGGNVQPITVSRLVIEDSEKVDNSNWGLSVYAEGPAVLNEIHAYRSERYSIQVSGTHVDLLDSTITGSGHHGIYVWEGSIHLDNCLVARGDVSGLYAGHSTVSILNSEFTENQGWGANIDEVHSGNGVTLFNSIFESNEHGFSIQYTSDSVAPLSLTQNYVVNNNSHGIVLETTTTSVFPDEFEFSENTIANNENGLISQYRSGTLNVFDSDIFNNRALDIKTERAAGILLNNSYLGEITATEMANEEENLTLIYDQVDNGSSGPVTIEELRASSRQTSPSFRIQPKSSLTSIGSSAEFYGLAEGTPLISYQWFLNGEAISRATNSLYRVNLVTSSRLGEYHVVATSAHGNVTSDTATLQLDIPPTAPTITVQPQSVTVDEGGVFFLTITAEGTEPFSYQWFKNETAITGETSQTLNVASAQMSDSAAYSVQVSNAAGSVMSAIAVVVVDDDGSNTVESDFHPADMDEDNQIVISELTEYGSAWKQGETWSVGPNPIPIAYVTRAGTLWKGGEDYEKDPNGDEAPLWWVNPGAALRSLSFPSNSPIQSSAVRTVDGSLITVEIQPKASTLSYAVEEIIPIGYDILQISDAGVYDAITRRIRWGVFMDNQSRRLTYQLVALAEVSTYPTIHGGASMDGGIITILQQSEVNDPNPLLPRLTLTIGSDGNPLGTITGQAGKVYIIESTDSLANGQWEEMLSVFMEKSTQNWVGKTFTASGQKFYRVRIQ
jgi:hypothetical protein